VHRLENLLSDVSGLDEGDQAERGLALLADDLKPEGLSQIFGAGCARGRVARDV
jgi:hypothetical protein